MYSKNCGNKIDDSSVCPQCQTEAGKGNKFCSSCGKEVKDYMSVCPNCGKALMVQSTVKEAKKRSVTKEYKAAVFKTTVLSLIVNVLSLLLLISLLCLPLYTCKIPVTKDSIDLTFSLKDDIVLLLDVFSGSDNVDLIQYKDILVVPFLELIFILITGVIVAVRICKDILKIVAIDNYAIKVKYDEKRFSKGKAFNFLRKNIIYNAIILSIGDVILSKIMVEHAVRFKENPLLLFTRHMFFFDGVTGFVAIVGVLLVGLISLTVVKNKEEIKLL